jgi:hypothetical protein
MLPDCQLINTQINIPFDAIVPPPDLLTKKFPLKNGSPEQVSNDPTCSLTLNPIFASLHDISLERKRCRLDFSRRVFFVQAASYAKQEVLREKVSVYFVDM